MIPFFEKTHPSAGRYHRVQDDSELVVPQRTRRAGLVPVYCLIAALVGAAIGLAAGLKYPQSTLSLAPSLVPQHIFTPSIPTLFKPDDRYVGSTSFVDSNWKRLVAPSEAVYLPETATAGMLPGFERPGHRGEQTNETNFYHVSNLHQLHCLNILRLRLRHYGSLEYDVSPPVVSADDAANVLYHTEHCVEYLRLTIMCGESMVIETNSPPGTPEELVNDRWGNPLGWGTHRECMNWDALVTWQDEQLQKWKELR